VSQDKSLLPQLLPCKGIALEQVRAGSEEKLTLCKNKKEKAPRDGTPSSNYVKDYTGEEIRVGPRNVKG